MSKPGCAIIDQYDGVYYGVLKISGKEISSTFLPFKDEEKALELYTHLVAHQDDRILCCHHLVRYQDEWLVALEYSKNIVVYFRERMKGGKSNKCIYTQDPIKSIFITNFGGRVKFLPNLNASDQPIEGDIDQLKYLMNYIVNMPFGSVIQNYQKFNMPNELSCFLTELNFRHFKKYMSPAFLLDAPLFWRPVDKFYFIINLDHILKRREIQLQRLEKCLRNWQKKYSCNWVLEVNCDPVFKSIYEHKNSSSPTSAYTSASYVSMVWYCSNVYHHYNDYATQKISIINIENELSRLLPELYLHLFEGLILYAKKTKSRERVFSKSIISEDI
ncbi:hypothetical protein V6Z12_D06G042600 [Gossypium hirsutum]